MSRLGMIFVLGSVGAAAGCAAESFNEKIDPSNLGGFDGPNVVGSGGSSADGRPNEPEGSGGSGGGPSVGPGSGGAGSGGANGTGGSPVLPDAGRAETNGVPDAVVADGIDGRPAADGCNPATWKAAASRLCSTSNCVADTPSRAIDGDVTTRYTTGQDQAGDETFTVTFPTAITAGGIRLFTSSPMDGPQTYRLELSSNGTSFGGFVPAITGMGVADLTVAFPATRMTAIRVVQTGAKTKWWSIHELTLLSCQN